MIWPVAVDCHMHIDKGQVWPRSPNPDGTFAGARTASGSNFASAQMPEDIAARSQYDRIVRRDGRVIDPTPPYFSDLDTLQGMTP